MDKTKYGKYFITDTPQNPDLPPNRGQGYYGALAELALHQ